MQNESYILRICDNPYIEVSTEAICSRDGHRASLEVIRLSRIEKRLDVPARVVAVRTEIVHSNVPWGDRWRRLSADRRSGEYRSYKEN